VQDKFVNRASGDYAKVVRIDAIIDSIRKNVSRDVLSELGLLDN
jgi:hypothetical protein